MVPQGHGSYSLHMKAMLCLNVRGDIVGRSSGSWQGNREADLGSLLLLTCHHTVTPLGKASRNRIAVTVFQWDVLATHQGHFTRNGHEVPKVSDEFWPVCGVWSQVHGRPPSTNPPQTFKLFVELRDSPSPDRFPERMSPFNWNVYKLWSNNLEGM